MQLDAPSPLPDAFRSVLAALFAGYARVAVEGDLTGGYSGARVLKVTPYRDTDTTELPTVVKLGPADLIRQEYDAYRRHVRGRLSGTPEVWGEPAYSVDRAVGGLRYGLVGAGLFEFVSLARYTETATPADLAHVLESRLFVHLATLWRHARLVADTPLGAVYADYLAPDRTAYFTAALASLDAGGTAPALDAPTVAPPDRPFTALPNPLTALPGLLSQAIPHRVATVHGDLNLENVLVDPTARTIRLIDFSHSREDHVLHDLLRLETGIVTRMLPARLAAAGLDPTAIIDLYRRLHAAADEAPPEPALHAPYVALAAIHKAAIPLLADPADWREHLVGLAAYLVGAGKYRNLDAPAKATGFWAAAAALDLAARQPAADTEALERAIPVMLERSPVLEAYRRGRIAEWAGPRHTLDERFVTLALLVDQGEAATGGRWQARPKRYGSLRDVLADVAEPALVILGAPGSGKSTLLKHLELELALAGLERPDGPLTFYLPLNHYKPAAAGDPPPLPSAWLAAQWAARFPRLPALGDLLAEGRMILLLDALNEMPVVSAAEARERVGMWKDFAQELAAMAPSSRVVFSCRSLDYSTPLSSPHLRVPQVRVEPLGNDQVRRFIEQHVPDHAEGLWSALVAAGHLDLVRSPYFLKLLVDQVEAAGDVPLGRAALFTGFVRQALVREVERDHPLFRPDTLLTERDVHRLTAARAWRTPHELPERGVLVPKLGELAYRLQVHSEVEGEPGQVRVDFDTALDLLSHARGTDIVAAGAALGVLDEDPGSDEVLYVHQLVQEYFAARELARAPDAALVRSPWRAAEVGPTLETIIDTLAPADHLPPLPQTGWEETTLLAFEMATDPAAFLRALMDTNLALAGRCAARVAGPPATGAGGPAPGTAGARMPAADAGSPLPAGLLDDLRRTLVRRSRDPEADLRNRIACGLAVGALGDPRFAHRAGPYGPYVAPDMVELPGADYPIGSEDDVAFAGMRFTAHQPRHSVTLAPFAIGRYPVTQAEYACFVEAGGYADDRWWDTAAARAWRSGEQRNVGLRLKLVQRYHTLRRHPELAAHLIAEGVWDADGWADWEGAFDLPEAAFLAVVDQRLEASHPRRMVPLTWHAHDLAHPSYPIVGITWYEARAYCRWLSAQSGTAYRLPTEVEWEAAARGPSGRRFPYGDRFDRLAGNTLDTHVRGLAPVGVFPAGDTPDGVVDLSGNCWELTSTAVSRRYEGDFLSAVPARDYRYPYDPHDGREDADVGPEVRRVIRGAAPDCYPFIADAACNSFGVFPDDAMWTLGFRVASSGERATTASPQRR